MARAIAPVDEGNLRESIDVSTLLARSQAGDKGALAPVDMYVGPGQHPQAITQEFGPFTEAAQPFMRPAWAIGRASVWVRVCPYVYISVVAVTLNKKTHLSIYI